MGEQGGTVYLERDLGEQARALMRIFEFSVGGEMV